MYAKLCNMLIFSELCLFRYKKNVKQMDNLVYLFDKCLLLFSDFNGLVYTIKTKVRKK